MKAVLIPPEGLGADLEAELAKRGLSVIELTETRIRGGTLLTHVAWDRKQEEEGP
jgi:hypothetical protein